ncbi:MAG: Hsp20/alpha crystallin family protein [Spirochaetia bacterium]
MRTLVKYSGMDHMEKMLQSVLNDLPEWNTGNFEMDIRENKDKYILDAELPGLNEKDIDVNIENNVLTISAQRDDSREENNDDYILKERKKSSFKRSFVLPKDVDNNKIEANFRNGILTLEFNKLAAAKPKKIKIK